MLVRLAVEVKLNGTRQSHPRGAPPASQCSTCASSTRACAFPTLEKAVSTRATQPSALQLNRQSKAIHIQLSPLRAFSKWQYGASSSTLIFATIFIEKTPCHSLSVRATGPRPLQSLPTLCHASDTVWNVASKVRRTATLLPPAELECPRSARHLAAGFRSTARSSALPQTVQPLAVEAAPRPEPLGVPERSSAPFR